MKILKCKMPGNFLDTVVGSHDLFEKTYVPLALRKHRSYCVDLWTVAQSHTQECLGVSVSQLYLARKFDFPINS